MPKERSDRSLSRASPYPCGPSKSLVSPTKNPLENEENVKEWEVARCPVCMEHPHNAVLLICSSHDKGCRPFMCDTSYRHSNCLDQFYKSIGTSEAVSQQEHFLVSTTAQPTSSATVSEATVINSRAETSMEGSTSMHENSENQLKRKLSCPFCRGDIKGWMVVKPARAFMNSKSRSCACETCDFSGTYAELRKHARLVHPEVRPSEADPEKLCGWRRLEQQRDLGDLISTLQSSTGEDDDSIFSLNENNWLTVFFLIRVLRPRNNSRSSSWHGSWRARAQVRRPTTRLWGESYADEYRDVETESSSDGTSGGGLRRSERIRRQPNQRQQRPPDES